MRTASTEKRLQFGLSESIALPHALAALIGPEPLQNVALDQLTLDAKIQDRLKGAQRPVQRLDGRAFLPHFVEVVGDIRPTNRADLARTELGQQVHVEHRLVADERARAPIPRASLL